MNQPRFLPSFRQPILLVLIAFPVIASCTPTSSPVATSPSVEGSENLLPIQQATPVSPPRTQQPDATAALLQLATEPATPSLSVHDRIPAGHYVAYCLEEQITGAERKAFYQVSSIGGDAVARIEVPYCSNTSISPTARYLAIADEFGPEAGIAILDLRSGQATQLPQSRGCDAPEWSPDEEWILAECVNGKFAFLSAQDPQKRVDFDSFEQNLGWCRNPRWSPDTQSIAFSCPSDLFPSSHSYALDVSCLGSAHSCPGKLTWIGPAFSPLAWSADSSFVVAVWVPDWFDASKGPPVFGVFEVGKETGKPLRILDAPEPVQGEGDAMLSPDGKALIYLRPTSSIGFEILHTPIEGGQSVPIASGWMGQNLSWLSIP